MNDFNISFEKVRTLLFSLENIIVSEVLPVFRAELDEYYKELDKYIDILKKNYIISNDNAKTSCELIGAEILDEEIASGFSNHIERQLFQRLNAIKGQLQDFSTNFSIDVKYFDVQRLKKMDKIISYIDWPEIFKNPANSFTACLGQSIKEKISKSKILSISIFDSLHKILLDRVNSLKKCFMILNFYDKESFKLKVRENLFPNITVPEIPNEQFVDKYIPSLYKDFAKYVRGEKLYVSSLKEAILEDYYTPFKANRVSNYDTLVRFSAGNLFDDQKQVSTSENNNAEIENSLNIIVDVLTSTRGILNRIADKINFNWQLFIVEKNHIAAFFNVFERQQDVIDPYTLVIDLEYYDKKNNTYKMMPLNLDGAINNYIRTNNKTDLLIKKRRSTHEKEQAIAFQHEVDYLCDILLNDAAISESLNKYLKENLPKENLGVMKSVDLEIKELERLTEKLKTTRIY